MDFNSLFSNNTSDQGSNSLIQKDADPAKYEAIKEKFCARRKLLDETLKNQDLEATARENAAFDLMQVKDDMRMLGISEIEYMTYLEREPASGSDQQLPLL